MSETKVETKGSSTTESETEPCILLPVPIAQELLNYLVRQPYGAVFQLVQKLHGLKTTGGVAEG